MIARSRGTAISTGPEGRRHALRPRPYDRTGRAGVMRMFFAPEETEEYEAALSLVIHRMGQWARERGESVDPFVVETALDYRHRGTRDGRLGLWEPRHIEAYLLDWMPRTITVLPGEELADVPGALAALLRYLDAMGLSDPRGASLADNLAAIETLAPRHAPAMADRNRWGMAKFWTTTAAEQGVDIHDPAALQRFVERAQRGEVTYDQDVLDEVMRNHLTRGPAAVTRAEPQLPVLLPAEKELRARAETSRALRWLRGIADWAGHEGRVLTATGNLRMADARALVAQLGTGDAAETVRSSTQLPRLGLAVEWAKKARLVRVVKGRLYAVAKAQPLLKDPLALWRRAFETFSELRGPLLGTRGSRHVESMLFDSFQDIVPDVLNTLYGLPHAMPWPRLRDSLHLAYRAEYDLTGHYAWKMELGHADRDLRTVLDVLEDLGAIKRHEGMADPVFLDIPLEEHALPPAGMPPELAELFGAVAGGQGESEEAEVRREEQRAELVGGPVELIRLTALGHDSVRRRLLAEGRDAPLIGELAHAPAAGLLGVIAEHYDPDAARTELAAWTAAQEGPAEALEKLTDAVRTCPFRTRAEAMLDALVEAYPDGEAMLRGLRGDPLLAPTVLSVLVRREVLGAEDLTEPESLLMVAESLLQLLETAGPEGFLTILGGQELSVHKALEAALGSGHPDRAGLADLRTVAEQARRQPVVRLGRSHQRRRPGAGGKGRGGKRRR
ncbi:MULTISPECIES: hypothetical protein [unclassified Streptomyces]|uniref:hypothetical protein n=1 Tax=unclassified Streptomyces TaxID=2593676 RepID=UPI002E0F41E5|nr:MULTISPECIES: hypothetical protein [unclassified Streptomyces]WSJ35050.1 hypothetical protein OG772_02490 [Streptomyces sp. NBC_01321]WSP61490.1 hypothetical protein OG466_05895 [Streptomyces sp. NBC_01240]WSU20563.1 hypothetical protein OG508_05815 [Streptomyces sp. NBC_01108]